MSTSENKRKRMGAFLSIINTTMGWGLWWRSGFLSGIWSFLLPLRCGFQQSRHRTSCACLCKFDVQPTSDRWDAPAICLWVERGISRRRSGRPFARRTQLPGVLFLFRFTLCSAEHFWLIFSWADNRYTMVACYRCLLHLL